MSGAWIFLPHEREWRLYDHARLQIRVSADRVDALARAHGRTRREVLDWIGSRPSVPLDGWRRAS